jgi:polyhydroxybutyrate depolymerase
MRFFLLVFTASFMAFSAQAQSFYTGTIQSGGLTRDYRVYIPAAYNANKAVPLLFNLHGYGSNNLEQDFYGNFKPIADTANFLMVLPNGTLDQQNKRYWNNFLVSSTVDDVEFISNLLDTMISKYNIDINRVYSTGMSNGGFMSYALACGLSNRIAAIASVTGTMVTPNLNNCTPGRAVPVMQIHGTADNTVPYNGLPMSAFVPIETLVNTWVNKNGCNATPVITAVPNNSTTDGCTAERFLYENGIEGSTVEFYKITGGGHTWPGAAINVGVTNQDFSASFVIWRFLNKYKLNQFTTASQEPNQAPESWRVFPNPGGQEITLRAQDAAASLNQVFVYDAVGKLQYHWMGAPTNVLSMEVQSWPRGVYRIQLLDNHGKQQVVTFVCVR